MGHLNYMEAWKRKLPDLSITTVFLKVCATFNLKERKSHFKTYLINFIEKYLKNIFSYSKRRNEEMIYHFDTEIFYSLYLQRICCIRVTFSDLTV